LKARGAAPASAPVQVAVTSGQGEASTQDAPEVTALRAELEQARARAAAREKANQEELANLRAQMDRFQIELKSGDLGEQQLLRYAQAQAHREEEVARLRGNVSKMRRTLMESHAMLQKLHRERSELKRELAHLQSVRDCAENLHVEYLKNVTIKYLELVYTEAEVREQAALVRVIGTALHFTQDERRRVEEVLEAYESSWGITSGISSLLG